MRIALYGGTFDPPHRGHLAVALAAADAFALERVELAPTGRQPLKHDAPGAGFEDRLAMMHLVCEGHARLRASAVDAPRADGAPNYTIDTLQALADEGNERFCIVGADSFLALRQWKDPEELLRAAEWIVVSRPGFSLDDLAPMQLTAAQRDRVHLLETVHLNIAATGIRERLERGEDCSAELLPSVEAYIRAHHLYK